MLVCLRALIPGREWKDGLLKFSFWTLNGGLLAMCILSLLPVGLMQTWASVEHGYWYARSSEFMQTPTMQAFRWMRVPGDTIFFLGAVALVVFVAGLKTGHSYRKAARQRRWSGRHSCSLPHHDEETGPANGGSETVQAAFRQSCFKSPPYRCS
jgi:hypothetical protein